MSSHLTWVGTNCLRQSLTPPLASPGQNVQLWDTLHESEEGCCAFCFSSISSNNGADCARIMCSCTTTKKLPWNCPEREFQTGFLKIYMFFISSTHPASHDDVSDCPQNVIVHEGKCGIHNLSTLQWRNSSACAFWLQALTLPFKCDQKKEKKSGKKAKIKCIIHPVSIKPGLRLRIFNNYLCSSINSHWSSCNAVNAHKGSDGLCSS